MKRAFWLLPLLLAGAAIWFAVRWKNAPPEVRYTVVRTGPLVDTLVTNGKVEPVSFAEVRAVRGGALLRLPVAKGQTVAAGAVVAELENAEFAIAIEAAGARVAQIENELQALQGGGRAADLADIDGQLARLQLDGRQLEKELAALRRLVEKQAATRQEVTAIEDRLAAVAAQRGALSARRAALFPAADRGAMEARLREARAAMEAARARSAQATLRAPVGGVVYDLELRPGAYLNPGDLVARLGRTAELLVRVYVDEPELGRVGPGLPAVITWDAMPERRWEGRVEKMPSQIVALGTRQVGEVSLRIDNADLLLPPGANINAAIRSREATGALIVPKEALRREDGVPGVFVLVDGNRVAWRAVKTGVTNITHAQIVEGLTAGDRVLLSTDVVIRPGMTVAAVGEEPAS
jgi:HlyD family secretion protein